MNLKVVITLLGVTVTALAAPYPPAYSEVKVTKHIHHGHHGDLEHIGSQEPEHHEKYAWSYPSYKFSYKVEDPKTHDFKGQHEVREGNHVHGEYWLIEPDGAKRTVKYHTDEHGGFNALVIRTPAYHQHHHHHEEHIIEHHHEEQEAPAQEPAPIEEAALEEEQAAAELHKSEHQPHMYQHKQHAVVNYEIHHPTYHKYHQEHAPKYIYTHHSHGKPKYYQGSYKGEQQGGGEEGGEE